MSPKSWLTLHNCEIYYLAAVNCHPAIIDLIFTRVHIYPEPGKGSYSSFLSLFILSGLLFTLLPFPTILAEVNIPRWVGGGDLLQIFQPIYFIWVTIYLEALSNNINPLPDGPLCPPCPTTLGLIGPRKKEKKFGFDDVS
jgi:hypothetical protein